VPTLLSTKALPLEVFKPHPSIERMTKLGTPKTEPNKTRPFINFSASVVLFQDVNNPTRWINTAKCAERVSTPYRKCFQTKDDIDINRSL